MKKVFGIISWLPDLEEDRKLREDRLNRLLKQLNNLWPDIPCLIIAQNWKDFKPKVINKHSIIEKYDCLGILCARKLLRLTFLKHKEFDYIIMFDDDAIIKTSSDTAPEEYMKKLDVNPEGFCFIPGNDPNGYADSQLNLCAISRYIYEKEDLPDFDPQKSEAFEDRIYSCLLHNKYPKNEFTPPSSIKCNHFHNPEEKAPSTWTKKDGKKRWDLLKTNTEAIERYIRFNKELPDRSILNPQSDYGDIDLVIPYVDSSDKKWQELFEMYNPDKNNAHEGINAKNRFRGQGDFFRYFFRCIDKNMPYIRKIHLIVQSESQIPSWLNRDTIHIVYHEEFIPAEYLPTFNSTAIEMFVPFIPGLAEKFIYANDDMYAYNKLDKSYFYDNTNLPRLSTGTNRTLDTIYGHHTINTYKLIYDIDEHQILDQGWVACPAHRFRPYLKSKCIECFTKYKEEILKSISMFRETKNLNMYLYDHYHLKNNYQAAVESLKCDMITTNMSTQNITSRLSNNSQILCIQDTDEASNIYEDPFINAAFAERFPSKCRYEKDGKPYVTSQISKNNDSKPSFEFKKCANGVSWIL